jgi:hypothetical protein
MYTGALRKTEPVSNRPNPLGNLKRSGISGAQLAAETWDQGLRWAMEQAEKHPVVDVVLELSMLGVVVLLGVGLSLEQMVPYLSEESVAVS